MTIDRWKLPASWRWVQASDVATIVGGGTPSTKDESNFAAPGTGIPWIGPSDLTGYGQSHISRGRRDLSKKGLAASGATLIPEGSVLFSSRAPIGYCAIAGNQISTNQGFKSWVCFDGISPEYVRQYLLASVAYIDSLASGTTFREVSAKRVASIAFPLSPLAEQRRIVAKLDALTTRLARARAELDRVRQTTKTLRQAIIDAQFRELATSSCPLIDAVDQKRGITYGIVQTGKPHDGGVPTVRGGDIKRFGIRLAVLKTVDPEIAKAYRRTVLQGGEVLISIRGTIGNAAVVRDELIGCNISREVALIPITTNWDGEFIAYFLSTTEAHRFLTDHTKGSAQPGINLSDLRKLPIPSMSRATQSRIAANLTTALARADRLEAEAVRIRALLDRLESAILVTAFRGELVPQDPNDEPASVLLERIRAQRATAPKSKRGQRAAVTDA